MYHVIARGNNKESIFFNDNDRLQFYEMLKDITFDYQCKIHVFCLMCNHFHLVIEIGHIPLSRIMQRLLSRYSCYINKKYDRVGHLFQGRYKSIIIQSEKYLLELCFYIHMNPVKTKIVTSADDFRWSSHLAYLKPSKLTWITTELINKILALRLQEQESPYQFFIANYEKNRDEINAPVLNESGEIEINDTIHKRINSRSCLIIEHLSIEAISEVVCHTLNIQASQLKSVSHNRDIVFARSMVAYFAHFHGRYYLKDIADSLQQHPDSISRTMHRNLGRISEDEEHKNQFMRIYNCFLGTKATIPN